MKKLTYSTPKIVNTGKVAEITKTGDEGKWAEDFSLTLIWGNY
jgi:hypothetical protein